VTSARVHHSGIVVRDVDASLRFWRDALGFAVMMDTHFDGDWETLFGGPTRRLRSVFLGDPARADAGIVELVQFVEQSTDVPVAGPASAGPTPSARTGFFLLSCYVDIDAVLDRLAALGLGGEPRRISVPGPGRPPTEVQMATVVDPDGVLVELIGVAAP
jgi:catechol 2,3-dioxygenase-like lactoylglutathione lyase family enzyme